MKTFKMVLAIAAFLSLAVNASAEESTPVKVATATVAAPALPSALCGRWYTPDHRHSNTWCAEKIDAAAGTAVVTWYSGVSRCAIIGMPTKLESDGVTNLKLSAVDKDFKYMHCASTFVAVLEKKGDEWSGKVFIDSAASQYDHAETTVTPKL